MLNQKDKLQRFVQVVEKNAADKCDEINAHVQKALESQLEKIEKQYSEELSRKLEAESRKTRTEINRKITAIGAESRKITAECRNSICDRVFDEVKQKLLGFCDSEDYCAYLERCLEKVGEVCHGEMLIFAKSAHTDKVKALSEKFSFVKQVSADDSIDLGGIVAVSLDGSVKIDCTLGYEMQQSREWFRACCFKDA